MGRVVPDYTNTAVWDADGSVANPGKGIALAATLPVAPKPRNATNKAVNFTSSNPAVATVDAYAADGRTTVRPVSSGTTTITATTVDGGFTASFTITIWQPTVAAGGVVWSNLNVARPGTFAAEPYAYDTWAQATSPAANGLGAGTGTDGSICPAGWRMPTAQEYMALFSKSTSTNFAPATVSGTWTEPNSGWTTVGGVSGTQCVTAGGVVFFPASGYFEGTLEVQGIRGQYNSTDSNGQYACCALYFNLDYFVSPTVNITNALNQPVRCVR